jgi:hypothetical protein
MYIHSETVSCAFNLDTADGCVGEFRSEEVADFPVFDDVILVLLICVPARFPISGDPESEAVGVNFLTHD